MSYSAEEYAHYILTKDIEAKNVDKIETYIRSILNDVADLADSLAKQDKELEILEEQVYVRDEFIMQMLEACKTFTTKKALVKGIKVLLDNSYIEL